MPTSQSFSWLAGDAADTSGQVQIEPVSGGALRTVDATDAGQANGNPKRHFSATVTSLTPGTAYRYRVGNGTLFGPWRTFSTPTANGTDLQFTYYGDAQLGLDSTWPSVVAQATAKAPNSVGSVHAGDLIDAANDESQWANWFAGLGDRAATTNIFAAPGNHEYGGDRKLVAWKAHFAYPLNQPTTATSGAMADLAVGDSDVARQYRAYFDHWSQFAAETAYTSVYQNVRFITLNATSDTQFLTPAALPACSGPECPSTKVPELWTRFQAEWLDQVLEQNTATWTVVTFHQPVYSAAVGRDEPILRQFWVPVLQEHNVDLVLMGHDHVYARGFNNADATGTPGLTTGPVYAVTNAGAKHYVLDNSANNMWSTNGATRVKTGQNVTTYQIVNVSADQLVYRAWVAETVGAGGPAVGSLFDEVTVTKRDGQKWVTETGVAVPAA